MSPHHRVPTRRVRAGPAELHDVLAVRARFPVREQRQEGMRGRDVVGERSEQVQPVRRDVRGRVAAGEKVRCYRGPGVRGVSVGLRVRRGGRGVGVRLGDVLRVGGVHEVRGEPEQRCRGVRVHVLGEGVGKHQVPGVSGQHHRGRDPVSSESQGIRVDLRRAAAVPP